MKFDFAPKIGNLDKKKELLDKSHKNASDVSKSGKIYRIGFICFTFTIYFDKTM